jgi:hypothetical protein
MYERFLIYFLSHTTEFVIGALSLSIGIVFISIIFVLFDKPVSAGEAKLHKNKNKNKNKKELKIKYSKEFLKRVKGIDLDLR